MFPEKTEKEVQETVESVLLVDKEVGEVLPMNDKAKASFTAKDDDTDLQ